MQLLALLLHNDFLAGHLDIVDPDLLFLGSSMQGWRIVRNLVLFRTILDHHLRGEVPLYHMLRDNI